MTSPQDGDRPDYLSVIRAAMLDAEGLSKIPAPEPLVQGVLFQDSLAWIYGPPGCYKSFITLDIAGCVGTGQSWQGHRVRRGTVLYVVAEGAAGTYQRVQAWQASMGQPMGGVVFLPLAVQVASPAEWSALIAAAAELGPALIILDTQARISVGLEENSATDMGKLIHRIEALRAATSACVALVHHSGRHGEHMRGSIALDGAANTVLRVTKADDLINLECVKQKDAPQFEALKLRAVPYEPSIIISGTVAAGPSTVDTPSVVRLRLAWWNSFETEWVTPKLLGEATGAPRTTLYRSVRALVRAGLAETKGDGSSRRCRLTRDPTVP